MCKCVHIKVRLLSPGTSSERRMELGLMRIHLTHFINFIEKTKVSHNTILVSMDVTSLYTNIPQEEGINTVCKVYNRFINDNPPIPSHYLKEMLGLIPKENLF